MCKLRLNAFSVTAFYKSDVRVAIHIMTKYTVSKYPNAGNTMEKSGLRLDKFGMAVRR